MRSGVGTRSIDARKHACLGVAFATLLTATGIGPQAHAEGGPAAHLQAMAAAERAAEKRWHDAERAKREYQRRSAAAHARMRKHGVSTMHASTPSPPNGAMCLAPGVEPARFSPVSTAASAGRASVSSDPAAFTRGASPQTASHLRSDATTSTLGLRRPPSTHSLLDTPATSPLRERRVAFLPAASREPALRGILRLANRSDRPATVAITAFDDTGRRFGPIALSIEAGHTAELSSSDIEQGNPVKGLPRGIGAGQGDWRLVIRSVAELRATAYAESADGLRSPLAQVPQSPDGSRPIPLFPGRAADAPGVLRLSNPTAEPAEVAILARDDTGRQTEARLTLPSGTSRWLAAPDMESGRGVEGAFGERRRRLATRHPRAGDRAGARPLLLRGGTRQPAPHAPAVFRAGASSGGKAFCLP